jgi:outer membrane protein assembly factor BamB
MVFTMAIVMAGAWPRLAVQAEETPAAEMDSASGIAAKDVGQQPFWPEFHGPERDNISKETGLLKRWPEGGPKLLWTSTDCGHGYSGMAIADGRIYTAGDVDDKELVIALDLDGKPLWKTANGASWTGPTPGARTTPTYNDGVVYHMSPVGRLAAYRADSGKEVWAVDLKKRFDAKYGMWAMSENLIVDGDKVLCLPGGTKALAAALDKHTGETIWATPPIADKAAYCSPVVGEYKGVRMMVTLTYNGAVCVNVENGRLLWSRPFRRLTVSQNATTPVLHNGYVFVSCGHFTGGQLLKINDDLSGVSEVWYKREFDNCHGGVILLDDRLYGCGCRLGGKGFYCVEFLSGKVLATDRTVGKVSLAYADGMLYALNHKGPMYLIEIEPVGFQIVSRFDIPKKAHGLYLCHPVICGGRLYIRHDTHLYCYDIQAKSGT